MAVKHYKQLGGYGLAVEVRREVFRLSQAWPKEERCERHSVSRLTDALAEAEETVGWLDVALECGYLDEQEYADLTTRCRQICGGLVEMMRDPDSWCAPSSLIREDPADYLAG